MESQTHYAYRVEPNGFNNDGSPPFRDIATKTFNLAGVKAARRRDLINQLIDRDGECLAKLPLKFDMMDKDRIDLDELTRFINGEF
jgi:hypothetical protein